MQKRYNSRSYVNIYDNRYREGQYRKLDYIMHYLSSRNGLILDFGCGTGLLYDYFNQSRSGKNNSLSNRITQQKMIGIDFSNTMISEFHKKVQNPEQFGSKVHLLVCDGENLPLRKDLFDEIYALTSLQNLSNLDEGLKEIRRTGSTDCRYGLTFLKKSLDLIKLSELMQSYFPNIKQIVSTPTDNLQYDPEYDNLEDWLFYL